MKNIMIDLETLSTAHNAVILSVGAVEFDETGTGKMFSMQVDPESCMVYNRHVDVRTVMWWLGQSEAARKTLFIDPEPLFKVLMELSFFISSCDPEPVVWGNGATFDNVILASAYKDCGIQQPWNFRNDRCFRTLKAMFPNFNTDGIVNHAAHCALNDALWQARVASNLLYILKSTEAIYGAEK